MNMPKIILKLMMYSSLVLSLSLASSLSLADSAFSVDRQAPIKISANFSEHQEKSATTTYSGQVVIEQGSLKIEADKVMFINKVDARLLKAFGKPARFQQRDQKASELIIAQAAQLNYELSKGVIRLDGNAKIVQQGSSISGEHIRYFIDEQRVVANSSKDNKKRRVQVIIPGSSN